MEARTLPQNCNPALNLAGVPAEWRLVESVPGVPDSRRGGRHVSATEGTDASWRLAWPGIGVFRINPRDRRVEYRLSPGASPDALREFLAGPIAAALLTFEGEDPLHGSAVSVEGGALCFLGEPGAGKSTLAAAFLQAGYPLITDDLLTIRWRGRRPVALPAYPEIRLWPATGRRLIRDFDALPTVMPATKKRRLDPRRYRGGLARRPVPVRVLYELRPSSGAGRPRSQPLGPREAFMALTRHRYNTTMLNESILTRQFHALSLLAVRAPIRKLWVPRFADLDLRRLPALILKDLDAVGLA